MNQSNKNQNILSSLSYFSVFFAPIIFPIFVWIFAEKPTSTHGRKALFNHIWVYIFLFFANLSFIFSREVFDKPFDNQEVISNVSFGIGIFLLLIAGIIFLFNIIRGINLRINNIVPSLTGWLFHLYILSLSSSTCYNLSILP
nr:hypothetical protein [Staphylococcus cohnii]